MCGAGVSAWDVGCVYGSLIYVKPKVYNQHFVNIYKGFLAIQFYDWFTYCLLHKWIQRTRLLRLLCRRISTLAATAAVRRGTGDGLFCRWTTLGQRHVVVGIAQRQIDLLH